MLDDGTVVGEMKQWLQRHGHKSFALHDAPGAAPCYTSVLQISVVMSFDAVELMACKDRFAVQRLCRAERERALHSIRNEVEKQLREMEDEA
jgi:hypothetical protein